MTKVEWLQKEHFDKHPLWEWTDDKDYHQPRDLRLNMSDHNGALFIKANFRADNSIDFSGYIAWSGIAYALHVFLGDSISCGANIRLRSLAKKRMQPICKKYNCQLEDLFPMRYETDFSDDDGNPIAGTFDFTI